MKPEFLPRIAHNSLWISSRRADWREKSLILKALREEI